MKRQKPSGAQGRKKRKEEEEKYEKERGHPRLQASPLPQQHQMMQHLTLPPLPQHSLIGASVQTFLERSEPGQPFLLCVEEQKNNIQQFYVIVDHNAIPCKAQTSLAAFDEL
ncbi:uncharacterized protein LOC144020131 [Festucalex cinctus]